MAAALVNARHAPEGLAEARWAALEAEAYHQLVPYPVWAFSDWRVEDRGTLPRCMPFVQTAVRRSARWLFGKPVQLLVPGNAALERFFRRAWEENRMPTRLRAAAERAGYQGGLALKWAFDATDRPALRFQTLRLFDEVRFFHDPLDRERLLMARVQFPYFDAAAGRWWLYREEWTAEEEVRYLPQPCRWVPQPGPGGRVLGQVAVVQEGADPDACDRWEIAAREPNPFGVIPVLPVRNLDADAVWGIGDLWGLFRVADRVNLAYHGMDRGNQLDSSPVPYFLDVEADRDVLDRPLAPGEPLALKTDNQAVLFGERRKGEVGLLEPKGSARPHLMEYVRDVRKQLMLAGGNVDLDEREITNNGRLTGAVFGFVYAPLIELTTEKRKTYGEDGIARFLERCALGLKRAGVPLEAVRGVSEEREETFDVQLRWASFFDLSEEEKAVAAERARAERDAGLLPAERAIELVAAVEGIQDVQALKQELAAATGEQGAEKGSGFRVQAG